MAIVDTCVHVPSVPIHRFRKPGPTFARAAVLHAVSPASMAMAVVRGRTRAADVTMCGSTPRSGSCKMRSRSCGKNSV